MSIHRYYKNIERYEFPSDKEILVLVSYSACYDNYFMVRLQCALSPVRTRKRGSIEHERTYFWNIPIPNNVVI